MKLNCDYTVFYRVSVVLFDWDFQCNYSVCMFIRIFCLGCEHVGTHATKLSGYPLPDSCGFRIQCVLFSSSI